MITLFSSCFAPQTYANKDKIVHSMAASITKKFSKVAQLKIEQYLEMLKLNTKVVLVDVREEREREVSYIPKSISKKEFEKNRDKYKDYTVVAYCTIGHRSSEFIEELEDKKNYKATYNLEESILGWTHRKLPLENKDGKTNKVHVYDDPWNLVHDDYIGVIE